MRTLLFFDQIQSGHGGKERPNVPLGVEKGGIGSATMFDKYLKQESMTLIATMYAGHEYYFEHEQECKDKIVNLINKVKAEVVICGPIYDYSNYAEMAANLTDYLTTHTTCKAIMCCAEEKNQAIIDAYKDRIVIVKMPKKGGVGLNESLHHMVKVAKAVGEANDLTAMQSYIF